MTDSEEDHRFDDATESFSSDEIFSLAHTDREIAVPLTPSYAVFKKLEVVNAGRINFMTMAYNTVALIALIVSSIIIVMARTTFSKTFDGVPGLFPDLTVYTFPKIFTLLDCIAFFLLFTYSVALFSVFTLIILKAGKSRILDEQIWVIMLLVSTVIYMIPYEASVRLRRDYLELPVPDPQDGTSVIDVFVCLRIISFAFVYILYFWFGAHSYRYLKTSVSLSDWHFYAPKLLVLLTYVAFKLGILFGYRVVFSEMPFASFAGFLRLYSALGRWPKLGVISVSVLTVMETIIALWMAFDLYRTFRVLENAQYVEHRTKILGFRFFLHQQAVFNFVYVITYILILFGLPHGAQVLQFSIHFGEQRGRGSYFDVLYAPFGLNLCVLAFVTIEAYTNLPADVNLKSILLTCRYCYVDENKEHCEPVVYRNTEPPSFSPGHLDLRPNCFVMQTTVELFNLSWFVYYHGTEKENKLKLEGNSLPVKIKEFLHDKNTDTKAIIAESSDRIIIAFKGTSSTQNLRTDIKVLYRSLNQVLGIRNSGELENRLMPWLDSRGFKRAKVHAGFADAYYSIRKELREILTAFYREKERPLLFTGHSLGGALATLCSIDALIHLGIPGRKIAVSTFGSPRVGNTAFQEFYDSHILMHWRIVAGGDIISRLPKLGYRHVGKKVILTSSGELFIDPSALEMIFWHSQSASIVHHRKACYLLAIKAWCESLETDYVPKFWPFPVSENDSRKFVTTFQKPTSRRTNFPLSSRHTLRRNPGDQAKRLQMIAHAIDALDNGTQEYESLNDTIAQKWERLTVSALHSAALNAPLDESRATGSEMPSMAGFVS
ncbi:Lipase [Gracilariopsis chorda]|uniref:Lipase n=1 Tax=Gracilariopsis chorda TaxID=448386 RepID=A0A2V3J2S8_9FLOR|nr:Lipase [Gracilariopsis chorda]|eukprot:PXF48297.1 Lipase [Gracilariopsis chorda]